MRRIGWLAGLFALALPAAGPGANFRLSDGLAVAGVYNTSGGNDAIVSLDGRWVFYRQDVDGIDAVELWRVATVGGTPERVSGILPAGSNVFGIELVPDGSRIVFYSPQDDADLAELYSHPVGAPAGSYVKVNSPLAPGSHLLASGAYSPDSARTLYYSGPDTLGTDTAKLWVAELDGSSQTPIVTLPLGRDFSRLTAPPDFAHALYVADAAVASRYELWSVPMAGGTPVKLNGALATGGDVSEIAASPAGGVAIYLADQQVDGRRELYVVPVAGGAATKLNATLAAGREISAAVFTPSGGRILYVESEIGTGTIREIWSVAPDGSGRVALLPAMTTGGALAWIGLDDDYLLYVADQLVDERYELFSVPLAGGAAVKLNPTLVTDGDVAFDQNAQPRVTPDGSRVVYAADQSANGLENLYSVPIGGGTATPVGTAAVFGLTDIRGIAIASDSDRVAMVRWLNPLLPGATPSVHLWLASLQGGGWTRIDSCGELCEVWPYWTFSPADPGQLFYLADQEVDGRFDLFRGDACLLCDGFDIGTTVRWSATAP